jgi:hypothetical protein
MTGLSIPEICKEIQDEATGFTPGYADFCILWEIMFFKAVLNFMPSTLRAGC